MEKLHPRAVWMFFFRFLFAYFGLVVILSFMVGPFILSRWIKRIKIEGGYAEVTDWGTLLNNVWIWICLVFITLLIFSYIWARLSCYFWRYELTESTYKAERGVIFKRYVSIPYERIQNVDIYRGIIARLLDLSDIHIQTAGFSAGGKGRWTEGRLPGLSREKAEEIREKLIKRVKGIKGQGL